MRHQAADGGNRNGFAGQIRGQFDHLAPEAHPVGQRIARHFEQPRAGVVDGRSARPGAEAS